MRMIIGDDIIVFLNKQYLKKYNPEDKNTIKKIIMYINTKKNLDLNGYYNVEVYIDEYYGIIIKIQKEELEYLDYYSEEIDINIEIIKNTFLYKINDIYSISKQKNDITIYQYNDNLYLKINQISDINLGKIIENSEIIYGKETKKIINNGKIINPEVIV